MAVRIGTTIPPVPYRCCERRIRSEFGLLSDLGLRISDFLSVLPHRLEMSRNPKFAAATSWVGPGRSWNFDGHAPRCRRRRKLTCPAALLVCLRIDMGHHSLTKLDRLKARAQALLAEEEHVPLEEERSSRFGSFAYFCARVARSFVRNRCPVRAAALAYTTV